MVLPSSTAPTPFCQKRSAQIPLRILRFASQAGDAIDLSLAGPLQSSPEGMQFEIMSPQAPPILVRSRLLGRHNAMNILAAILAARECALSIKEILSALAVLAPFEHRLQWIKGPAGVYYIDDAYNSNPQGAAMALEVLASFTSGRKILVTPRLCRVG